MAPRAHKPIEAPTPIPWKDSETSKTAHAVELANLFGRTTVLWEDVTVTSDKDKPRVAFLVEKPSGELVYCEWAVRDGDFKNLAGRGIEAVVKRRCSRYGREKAAAWLEGHRNAPAGVGMTGTIRLRMAALEAFLARPFVPVEKEPF